jgi:DNA mismatch repair protein MutL
MAKNAGIKAGTVLESDEMNKLVQDLFQCEHPGLTPQGKKTFVPVDNQMLSQLFE